MIGMVPAFWPKSVFVRIAQKSAPGKRGQPRRGDKQLLSRFRTIRSRSIPVNIPVEIPYNHVFSEVHTWYKAYPDRAEKAESG